MTSWTDKALTLISTLFLTACFGSGKKPLETLSYRCESKRHHNLIVFIRGLGGTLRCPTNVHRCFQVEGFVEAVQSRQLPYDMVAPNAHMGYYQERTLVQRLRTDVILPAKANGYQKIWIVGVSMGGLGALLYLKEHPEDVAGVVALGPYLGNDEILDEIQAAGGVRRWHPGRYDPNKQWQRMLWDWLKHYPNAAPNCPPIIMGLATKDIYLKGHRLMADTLPNDQVFQTVGKHRFKSFKVIWDKVLEQQLID
jgi:pimeloyl-ACP methyl ester carboxylesterase